MTAIDFPNRALLSTVDQMVEGDRRWIPKSAILCLRLSVYVYGLASTTPGRTSTHKALIRRTATGYRVVIEPPFSDNQRLWRNQERDPTADEYEVEGLITGSVAAALGQVKAETVVEDSSRRPRR